jgi:hypothetical protein
MLFEYESNKKIRLGNLMNYCHVSKISGKFGNPKKSKEQSLFERIFDSINQNPQAVISLISLAIGLVTLANSVMQFLIILHK